VRSHLHKCPVCLAQGGNNSLTWCPPPGGTSCPAPLAARPALTTAASTAGACTAPHTRRGPGVYLEPYAEQGSGCSLRPDRRAIVREGLIRRKEFCRAGASWRADLCSMFSFLSCWRDSGLASPSQCLQRHCVDLEPFSLGDQGVPRTYSKNAKARHYKAEDHTKEKEGRAGSQFISAQML
jgi:hypothetical protein